VTIAVQGLCPLLQVFDMPRSIHFYRDILGFSVVRASGEGDHVGWAWLRHGNAELMLNTAFEDDNRPETADPERVASHADTILYMGCADLDEAYSYLRAQGVEAEPPAVRPYGMKQLGLTDPDGYGLCFQWPAQEVR
jgi:glyoxylase I family protein